MSALGQKQTFRGPICMSALPPKADIAKHCWDVRFNRRSDRRGLDAFALRRLQPLNNATGFGIVRADFNLHSVADCEAYVMNLKLSCGLCQ
jgi:hypothetical protein